MPPLPLAGRKPAHRLAAPVDLGPLWGSLDRGMALHFSRVAPAIEELEIWSASERGFSFVISNESSSGEISHSLGADPDLRLISERSEYMRTER